MRAGLRKTQIILITIIYMRKTIQIFKIYFSELYQLITKILTFFLESYILVYSQINSTYKNNLHICRFNEIMYKLKINHSYIIVRKLIKLTQPIRARYHLTHTPATSLNFSDILQPTLYAPQVRLSDRPTINPITISKFSIYRQHAHTHKKK